MGFKKENYTLKGLCVCIYFLVATNLSSIYGQSHCPIRVDYEPREVSQVRSANIYNEVKFPFFQQWQNLSDAKISNDTWANVMLPNNKRSTLFKGQNLGFSIPNGAQISGIELIVEGHTNGLGIVEDQMIRLLDENGDGTGFNMANNALPIGDAWTESNDSTDFTWRYGSPTDTWGSKLSDDLINGINFGYALQVRNKLNEPVEVLIDHIQMIIYYTPLYEICSTHACVPFYVDDTTDPLVTYEWYLPQGFELISDSEEDAEINIGVSYADFGEYEICVESFYDLISQGTCCRKFNYLNCQPSLISGQVFFDKNNDSSNNNGDTGISNIDVNLYSSQGALLATTTTNEDGDYQFQNLLSDQYYIEVVDNVDSLVFTLPNIGNDMSDSDITDAFGDGTSDLINLDSGDSIFIDAGFNLALNIGNFVWEDLNGDGIQQFDEPGIEGIEVNITNSQNSSSTTVTNADGYYSFNGLPAGDYSILFVAPEEYIATIPNNSDSDSDSDYIPNMPIMLSYTEGGTVDSIDAGFYQASSIGDFVWEDTNEDGLQDESELGITDVLLNLMSENDEILQSTMSDSLGFYSFVDIAPGDYYIEIQTESIFVPTSLEVGSGTSSEIDSDVFIQDDKFVSTIFTLNSNSIDLSIDFGFVEKPASIGGFTFLDDNNNGQYDDVEGFISAVNVFIFDNNNTQIDSTQSDSGGFYLFENIPAGAYYLVFELKDDLLYTLADVGEDLSDSDVTEANGSGSTDIILLSPDETNLSVSAGFQKKAKVGDYIWLDENANGIQDADEGGLNEITIEIYNDQDSLIQSMLSGPNPESNAPGYYLFRSLLPGDYYIRIPENEEYNFAIVDDSAPESNSDITDANGIGTSNTFSLVGNECNLNIDAGYALKKGSITGEVWIDKNEDGIQDLDEELKSGVRIELYSSTGDLLFFRNSDPEGQYIFPGLDAGEYFLIFSPSDQYRFTNPFASLDPSLDSDVNSENSFGSTSLISVMDGVTTEHIDAGLIDGRVKLDGITWIDDNGDGILQIDELPLPNVEVELFNLNDSLLATTVTDASGFYAFDDNMAGQYYMVFTPEEEQFINTAANQGMDDNTDDDVTSFFTTGSTDTINVEFFEVVNLINAGYYVHSTIGDQVFIDINENGINDNEAGLDGVVVNLIDSDGEVIASDETAQGGGLDSGYYLIENIPPGIYTVQFIRPLFYPFVAGNQGIDDSIDSDVVDVMNNSGTTQEITITSGTNDLSIDAGVFFEIPTESSITGIVWDDINNNGLRENDESPILDAVITLENQDGEVLGMVISDNQGVYLFDNLPEGFYLLKATTALDKVATFANIGNDDTIDSDFIDTSNGLNTESFFLAAFEDLGNIDLGLVNKLQVGDFVWEDTNNNGTQDAGELGIEEIEITITSENGLISETTMSNADGSYQFDDLPAGQYILCADLPSGFHFAKSKVGTDLLDSDIETDGCTTLIDLSSGGVANNLDIGLTKEGSIEGVAFVDLNGNGINNINDSGLDGVIVLLFNDAGELISETETITIDDNPGVFRFSNLKATDYYLVFVYPEEYIITSPDVADDMTDSDITGQFEEWSTDLFSIPSGGTVTNIAGGAYLPASIGDEVWLDENQDGIRGDDENGVGGIEVIIFRSFGVPFDTTITDQDGLYQFENLKQGLYFIQFVIPQEFAISPSDEGLNDSVDSDADETGKTPLISLAHGADLESVDCGIYSSMASLRSIVWNDINGDGIRQDQEARIPGIRVSLMNQMDDVIASTETNSLGLYAFQQIPAGEYKVFVDIEDTDYAFTPINMSDNDFNDSDIQASGESDMFMSYETESALSVPNVDAGLFESGGIISVVWEDENANGIYDLNESVLEGIEVSLYTKEGSLIKKTSSTDQQENINFTNIPPGEYYLKYKIDQTYVLSPIEGINLDDNNSDVHDFDGSLNSSTFQVMSNEMVSFIDAGFYKGAIISSNVWNDSNSNGIQDDSGPIPSGVYATLYDKDENSRGTRGINEDGQIQFYGIPKGEYYIKYYGFTALRFTKVKGSDKVNSDVDHSNGIGTTPFFKFDPYTTYTHIDAGLDSKKEIAQVINSFKDSDLNNESRAQESKLDDELLFEVHPNPAANYLKINIDRNQSEGVISIYNNQNQLVYTKKAKEIDKIDLGSMHPGIYYVKYEVGGNSVVKKVLKIQ